MDRNIRKSKRFIASILVAFMIVFQFAGGVLQVDAKNTENVSTQKIGKIKALKISADKKHIADTKKIILCDSKKDNSQSPIIRQKNAINSKNINITKPIDIMMYLLACGLCASVFVFFSRKK